MFTKFDVDHSKGRGGTREEDGMGGERRGEERQIDYLFIHRIPSRKERRQTDRLFIYTRNSLE